MPIHYGEHVRLQHCSTGHRLHSHNINYPNGSRQQQVTCFNGKDDNDWFKFKPAHGHGDNSKDGQPVRGGDHVRLEHIKTRKNLHSHNVRAHQTGGPGDQHEVSCFEHGHKGDNNDNWKIECRGNLDKSDQFRLVHCATNGALHSHNIKYSFIDQFEVTTFTKRDNNDMWKIEDKIGQNQGGHNHGHGHGHNHNNNNSGAAVVGGIIGGMLGLGLGMGATTVVTQQQGQPPVYSQQPPQAYPPQQQAYPPQQQAYPPQQQAYPPQQQAYPPQQQQVPQYTPPPQQNLPVSPPPMNATIHVVSMNSNKNLRIRPNGNVDCEGGNGNPAKFMVQPTGFLRLASVANPQRFLALRKQKVDHGPGGPACELLITGTPFPGIVTLSHAKGNGFLASGPGGDVYISQTTGPNDRATHFRINLC
eukprot:m.20635 g.20635  ORF g.20635 m.20635 type:complete len:417 (+) comp13029_c0_seq1:84-1334(+)